MVWGALQTALKTKQTIGLPQFQTSLFGSSIFCPKLQSQPTGPGRKEDNEETKGRVKDVRWHGVQRAGL